MRIFSKLARWERVLLLFALVLIIIGSIGLVIDLIQKKYDIKPQGGTYVEVIEGRVDDLDPFYALPETPEYEILSLIFSGFLQYDANTGTFVGDIADTFDVSEDFTTFNFHIRDSVKWHDGKKLTLDDVIYTFELIKNPDLASPWYNTFKNAKIEADTEKNTVRIILPQSDRLFIQTFTLFIVPKHLLENVSVDQIKTGFFASFPVGSGMFSLLDIIHSTKRDIVKLSYFQDYYTRLKPNISLLQFEFVEDIEDGSDASAYRSIVPEGKDNLVNYSFEVPRYRSLFFNVQSSNMRSINSRRGIEYVIQNLLYKTEEKKPIVDIFTEEASHDAFETYVVDNKEEDVESKIREYFYNAGWQLYSKEFDDGIRRNKEREKVELKLLTLDIPEFKEQAELIKTAIEKYGVIVNVGAFSWEELYTDFIEQGKYDLLLLDMDEGYGKDLYKYLHSSIQNNFVTGRNFSQFGDIEFDILLEDIRLATDKERVNKVLSELEKRYDTYLPFFYIEKTPYIYSTVSQLQGVRVPQHSLNSQDRFTNFHEMYFYK